MPEDLAELEALFAEHGPRLRAWLQRRIPPSLTRRLDPEDVMQEAFGLARAKYDSFKQRALAAYPWLYGIVRDCYLKQWERHTRECRNHLHDLPWPEQSSVQLGLGLIARNGTPSEEVTHEEQRQHVLAVIEQLSSADREVLAMRYWEGFSFAEVASVLGIEENTARVRHARALRRFRSLWEEMGRE